MEDKTIFSVNYNEFLELMQKFSCIDNEELKIELDKAFKKCCQNSNNNNNNKSTMFLEDGSLVRF